MFTRVNIPNQNSASMTGWPMSRSCQSRSCCLLDVLEIVIDSVMDPTFHVTMSHRHIAQWWDGSQGMSSFSHVWSVFWTRTICKHVDVDSFSCGHCVTVAKRTSFSFVQTAVASVIPVRQAMKPRRNRWFDQSKHFAKSQTCLALSAFTAMSAVSWELHGHELHHSLETHCFELRLPVLIVKCARQCNSLFQQCAANWGIDMAASAQFLGQDPTPQILKAGSNLKPCNGDSCTAENQTSEQDWFICLSCQKTDEDCCHIVLICSIQTSAQLMALKGNLRNCPNESLPTKLLQKRNTIDNVCRNTQN